MTNFVEELRWRGLLHDIMPETEAHLLEHATAGYIGFDPTADSLHIGSLVQILILKHFQNAGHKPIALVGGATGMVGDPSGKSAERNLLDEASLLKNIEGVKSQLSRFLDFDTSADNPAELVNNFDWMKDISLIDFVRDTGKHITVNYMMAKDSVKKRLSSESKEGMSFTEFTYQLFQGYDFYHLFKEKDCKLQMGGSDQWGNITTGTELIRRKAQGKAYAITVPLVTKADGTKFGKTEGGNVWLDAKRTSPYKFYQYWLNSSDEDAEKYIKIFTFFRGTSLALLLLSSTPKKCSKWILLLWLTTFFHQFHTTGIKQCFFVAVRQNTVRFSNFVKLFFGFFTAFVFVWMIFDTEFAVRFFDLTIRSFIVYTKNFVRIKIINYCRWWCLTLTSLLTSGIYCGGCEYSKDCEKQQE